MPPVRGGGGGCFVVFALVGGFLRQFCILFVRRSTTAAAAAAAAPSVAATTAAAAASETSLPAGCGNDAAVVFLFFFVFFIVVNADGVVRVGHFVPRLLLRGPSSPWSRSSRGIRCCRYVVVVFSFFLALALAAPNLRYNGAAPNTVDPPYSGSCLGRAISPASWRAPTP